MEDLDPTTVSYRYRQWQTRIFLKGGDGGGEDFDDGEGWRNFFKGRRNFPEGAAFSSMDKKITQ